MATYTLFLPCLYTLYCCCCCYVFQNKFADAWSQPSARIFFPTVRAFSKTTTRCFHLNLKLDDADSSSDSIVSKEDKNGQGKESEQNWGVSYIGGDPCGSKYNDDPHDNKPSKPGFPDNMKARIEALAEQKRKESEAK